VSASGFPTLFASFAHAITAGWNLPGAPFLLAALILIAATLVA
jgi:hypothetical protein